MDLISREAVIEQAKASYHVAESMEQLGNLYEDCINALPSAFEGMTYGEVMKAVLGIKDEQIVEAMYLISIFPKGNHHDPFMAVKREVWNSPYNELSVILGTVGVSE